jgi:hypothetical protein
MHDHHAAQSAKKRRRRAARKPLPEIEEGTEAVRARGLASVQELFTMIMTLGNLSEAERHSLFNTASKAIGETIESIGFQALLHNARSRDAGARVARCGNAERVVAWHDEAVKLAFVLWERKPQFRGNADKTAKEIHSELEKECARLGTTAPKPRTVAGFISTLKEPLG